jgi:hypothetical protein
MIKVTTPMMISLSGCLHAFVIRRGYACGKRVDAGRNRQRQHYPKADTAASLCRSILLFPDCSIIIFMPKSLKV